MGEISKTQKMSVCEGKITYENVIPKQGFVRWFNNQLNVELPFTYRFFYNAKNIEIVYVDKTIVKARLPDDKDCFELIVALDINNIKQLKDKESFAVDFNSVEFQNILKVAQEDTKKYIYDNDIGLEIGRESIREFVINICIKFGFTVEFVD